MTFEYGEYYKKYDMSGEIKIGTGIVKVHDIFNTLPEFMKGADVIFCDPPCSKGNLNSFYSKAGKIEHHYSYLPFQERFWQCIDMIKPNSVFIEVFKSNIIAFQFVKKAIPHKERKNLILKSNYLYYLLFNNEKIISVIGVKIEKNNKIKLHCCFTFQEYRNKGYFTYLLKFIMEQYKDLTLYAEVYNSSLYIFLKQGFECEKGKEFKTHKTFKVIFKKYKNRGEINGETEKRD